MRKSIILALILLISATSRAENIFFGDKLIKVDLQDFKISKINNETDRFYLSAIGTKEKISFAISISMEAYPDSLTYRQAQWKKNPKAGEVKENIREYEHQPYAIAEWTDAPVNGIAPRHLNAYWAKEGMSAKIHIFNANNATSEDLQKTLARINISDIPLVYQLCFKGKVAFDRTEYSKALEFLRLALAENNKTPELNPKEQRDLSLWAGISEAMCGNLPEAEIIFSAAIKKDPTYALFHYNLACIKAEQGKLPQALQHLENALQNRTNINPGQELPDPLSDSSFKPFKDDKELKALLQKYPPLPPKTDPQATPTPQQQPQPMQEEKIPPRKLSPLI